MDHVEELPMKPLGSSNMKPLSSNAVSYMMRVVSVLVASVVFGLFLRALMMGWPG